MTQPTNLRQYQVYLLRLWQETGDVPPHPDTWRFSLEDPTTKQRRGFSCLAELTAYLENVTSYFGEGQDSSPDPNKVR